MCPVVEKFLYSLSAPASCGASTSALSLLSTGSSADGGAKSEPGDERMERRAPPSPPPDKSSLLIWVCDRFWGGRPLLPYQCQRPMKKLFTGAAASRSGSTSSTLSVAPGFILNEEPITLYRLELERLQYIFHFPEEVAFQLSATEYQLFYSIQPMDYVRYVSCDLTSVPVCDNPSPLRNLVKRLSEVSSWITHVIVSQPTHEDRKIALASILRMIQTCWNIGNFNAAVEILMGLKSEKLRPFWLSLRPEEKQQYQTMCEILLPSQQAAPSQQYLEAIQRSLRMPQCRLIPFFGIFLRDLYAIVNDVPSVVVIGQQGEKSKLEFTNDYNGEDHFSSRIGVGGLLNADKINLVGVVLENLETFHKHFRTSFKYVGDPPVCGSAAAASSAPTSQPAKDAKEVKGYEPVQPVRGSSHGVTLIPLDTSRFDLDVVQRLQHGTTVIHYDPDTGRSVLCLLRLDPSCGVLSWHKVGYGSFGGKEAKEKEGQATSKSSGVNAPTTSHGGDRSAFLDANRGAPAQASSPRPTVATMPYAGDSAWSGLDEGFVKLSFVKSVEAVDSYDLDIEAIYRRHSVEEMSVPVFCWTISYGGFLSENEFLYFLAPQQIAQYWMGGLHHVTQYLQDQHRFADRRVLWLKKLYLELYHDADSQNRAMEASQLLASGPETPDWSVGSPQLAGPRPFEALQAFGGRVDRWRGLGVPIAHGAAGTLGRASGADTPGGTSDGGGATSRLKQMTIAVTRRMRGSSRDASRSQSPQPQSSSPKARTKVRPPSIKSHHSTHSGPPGPNSPGYLLKPRDTAQSDTGDLDSIYTPRSRTPTSSSYGGRSVGGRSIKSWRSRGGETPGSGSISSSGQVSALGGVSGREYQDKPMALAEFVELYRSFSIRMRKDLRDIFNEYTTNASANGHVTKSPRDKHAPRLQSRLDSLTGTAPNTDFVPNDVLTRNSTQSAHINDKQQKIYNALALASVNR
uniref:Ras-GEF domain-containing protein n=1 Tax=Plectus sambesii TaxID=2011161 RepID=A0A914VGV4_9BILA